jgi:hypothetical protein
VQDLTPRLTEVVRAVFAKKTLEKRLARESNKPAVLRVTPAAFVLSVRFDAERLEKAIDGRPVQLENARALYLDAYYPIMHELAAFRERVVEEIESSRDAQVIADVPLTLKLTKPGGDTASIDFATLDDRVLLTDTIRMKLGGSG